MAVYNARGTRADGAIQIGEPMASRLPADYRLELLPRDVAELAYPAPYRDELRKFAIPSGVDPRFELSIARQESRFKPWVKSPAGARGLMQFIPETSNRIASALGVAHFDQDDLYEPDVAVRFGAQYLGELFAMFPDNPYAVAASYNGGEDSVARWVERAADPKDVDLVVAEISYKETKTYVYRVMNNYWAYQSLYTRELNPR
jgi:soluble lytic murein transglycosylase